MGPSRNPPQSWERRQHESARAFAAFRAYLDLGPERSVDRAFRTVAGESAARAPRRWFVWSRRFDWPQRVQAWDRHMAAVNQAQKEQSAKQEANEWAERRRQMRERQWRIAQSMLDKTESILRLPLVRTRLHRDGGTTVVEPVRVAVGDAARLGQTASDLAREALEAAMEEHKEQVAPRIARAIFRPHWLEEHDENNDPVDKLVREE